MALQDDDREEFRALPLILQHRALVKELDAIAAMVESCECTGVMESETAERLLPALRRFTAILPVHFAVESKSTAALLRECEDLDFARRLIQLDGEHPHLLVRFEDLARRFTSSEQVVADLRNAIEDFRRHEEEEDALFVK